MDDHLSKDALLTKTVKWYDYLQKVRLLTAVLVVSIDVGRFLDWTSASDSK